MTVRNAVKQGVFAVARWAGIAASLRWAQRQRVLILCYHSTPARLPVPALQHGGLHLTGDGFTRQMEWLARTYRVISLQEVVDARREGRHLPERAAIVTFDDGYLNNLTVAGPVLSRYQMPATIFVATDYIDRGDLYWWDEVACLLGSASTSIDLPAPWNVRLDPTHLEPVRHRADELMASSSMDVRQNCLAVLRDATDQGPVAGVIREQIRPATWSELSTAPEVFSFGAHTAEHRVLDRVPVPEIGPDLERCKDALDQHLGERTVSAFCYPAGRFTDDVVGAVRNAGFGVAVTTATSARSERLSTPEDDAWRLPRVSVSGAVTLNGFVTAAAGAPGLLGGG